MGLFDSEEESDWVFEQYPDYAMMGEPGARRKKPWVSGPSPLSMGLMTGGLGILAQPTTVSWGESGGGGGFDPSYIAKGGLLGLQAFGQEHQNLRNQRQDFFTQRRAEESQAITNIKARQEWDDREEKKKQFPLLMKELKALNNPAITAKLPALMRMPVDKAYATAGNLLSTAAGKKWGAPELIGGSIFQRSGDEYKYLTTPSGATTKLKLSAPEITGQLFDASANLKKWNLEGRKGLKPAGLDIFKYNSMYREKMRIDKDKIKVTDKLGASKEIIEERLIKGILDPTAYAIMNGMDTAKIKALGIDKQLVDTREYSSEAKRSLTEAKDIAKVGIIAQVENSMGQDTFDPTTVSLSQYGQYFTSGFFPSVNDFSKKARSYENMALAGSRMFGYLFSGATVKDDENRAMRQVLYPMPGDSNVDVERKKQFRETVLSLYKTYIPPDISKKLFKKVIANAKVNKVTTIEEIEEELKNAEKKNVVELTDPIDIQNKLDKLIPQ